MLVLEPEMSCLPTLKKALLGHTWQTLRPDRDTRKASLSAGGQCRPGLEVKAFTLLPAGQGRELAEVGEEALPKR